MTQPNCTHFKLDIFQVREARCNICGCEPGGPLVKHFLKHRSTICPICHVKLEDPTRMGLEKHIDDFHVIKTDRSSEKLCGENEDELSTERSENQSEAGRSAERSENDKEAEPSTESSEHQSEPALSAEKSEKKSEAGLSAERSENQSEAGLSTERSENQSDGHAGSVNETENKHTEADVPRPKVNRRITQAHYRISCPECTKVFTGPHAARHLLQHFPSHKSSIRPYHCTGCDLKTGVLKVIEQSHMARHMSKDCYYCPLCDKLAHHKSEMMTHLSAHLKGKRGQEYREQSIVCCVCSARLTSNRTFVAHFVTHFENEDEEEEEEEDFLFDDVQKSAIQGRVVKRKIVPSKTEMPPAKKAKMSAKTGKTKSKPAKKSKSSASNYNTTSIASNVNLRPAKRIENASKNQLEKKSSSSGVNRNWRQIHAMCSQSGPWLSDGSSANRAKLIKKSKFRLPEKVKDASSIDLSKIEIDGKNFQEIYLCTFCNRDFGCIDKLKFHLSNHTDTKLTHDFIVRSAGPHDLKGQMKVTVKVCALKPEEFRCNKCMKYFCSPAQMKSHSITMHQKNKDKNMAESTVRWWLKPDNPGNIMTGESGMNIPNTFTSMQDFQKKVLEYNSNNKAFLDLLTSKPVQEAAQKAKQEKVSFLLVPVKPRKMDCARSIPIDKVNVGSRSLRKANTGFRSGRVSGAGPESTDSTVKTTECIGEVKVEDEQGNQTTDISSRAVKGERSRRELQASDRSTPGSTNKSTQGCGINEKYLAPECRPAAGDVKSGGPEWRPGLGDPIGYVKHIIADKKKTSRESLAAENERLRGLVMEGSDKTFDDTNSVKLIEMMHCYGNVRKVKSTLRDKPGKGGENMEASALQGMEINASMQLSAQLDPNEVTHISPMLGHVGNEVHESGLVATQNGTVQCADSAPEYSATQDVKVQCTNSAIMGDSVQYNTLQDNLFGYEFPDGPMEIEILMEDPNAEQNTFQEETNLEQKSQLEQTQSVAFQQMESSTRNLFQQTSELQSASFQYPSAQNQSASALIFNAATQFRSVPDLDISVQSVSAPNHSLYAPNLGAPSQILSSAIQDFKAQGARVPNQGLGAQGPSASHHILSAPSVVPASNQMLRDTIQVDSHCVIPSSSSSQPRHILTPRSSLYQNVSLITRPTHQPVQQKNLLRNILTHPKTSGK